MRCRACLQPCVLLGLTCAAGLMGVRAFVLMPQDKYHLYLLFDLMSGGDLMDVLVAEARVIRRRIAQGAWRRACLAPKARSCATGAWTCT